MGIDKWVNPHCFICMSTDGWPSQWTKVMGPIILYVVTTHRPPYRNILRITFKDPTTRLYFLHMEGYLKISETLILDLLYKERSYIQGILLYNPPLLPGTHKNSYLSHYRVPRSVRILKKKEKRKRIQIRETV